ncbi:hypothetical protein J32TS6_10880 [Virgibacillus pantothenticus]|nr:hypothetical protein J32TS6_10880 [Virgibacillus pantothenticus]
MIDHFMLFISGDQWCPVIKITDKSPNVFYVHGDISFTNGVWQCVIPPSFCFTVFTSAPNDIYASNRELEAIF